VGIGRSWWRDGQRCATTRNIHFFSIRRDEFQLVRVGEFDGFARTRADRGSDGGIRRALDGGGIGAVGASPNELEFGFRFCRGRRDRSPVPSSCFLRLLHLDVFVIVLRGIGGMIQPDFVFFFEGLTAVRRPRFSRFILVEFVEQGRTRKSGRSRRWHERARGTW